MQSIKKINKECNRQFKISLMKNELYFTLFSKIDKN